jgi:SAM-dependent methyltransferase
MTLLSQVYASLPQDRWTAPLSVAQLTLIERLSQDDAKAVRLLDVGAFDGGFLKALPEHFEKCAIEPSAGGRAALEGLGIELLGDFLVKAPPSLAHQFDVVTMFDVYEHLVDPITGVKNLLSWLKPGGRLYIGTGNMDHWSWKVMKGRHWYLDPIQHVVVGSAQHFRFLGRMLDLKVTVQSFPHQSGDVGRRLRETLLTIYFALRSHSVFGSVASRVLHRLHVLRKHSHQRNIPYMQSLSDHILVTFRKKVDHC